jgi:superfamily II DNA or RNA helicase
LSRTLLNHPSLKATANDFPWIAQEYNALKQMLEGDTDQISNDAVLWQIYAPKPEWEVLLEQLDNILNLTVQPNSAKEERLIWRFDPETFHLEPILQKLNKNGSWSKGRKLNAEKYTERELSQISTAQDLDILKAHQKVYNAYLHTYDNEVSPELIAELLDKMVGCPSLYLENSNDTAFQISRGKLELQLVKTDKGYHFDSPFKLNDKELPFIFKRETPTRYSFIPISKEQQQLITLLSRKKVFLPNQAEDQLKEKLKKMASILPVHSDLIIDDSSLPEHPCDSRIFVHFLPVGEFFNVELFVKPFSEIPPYFTPGKGYERVIAELNGTTYFVKRDLNIENTAAEELIATSTVLDLRYREGDIWTLDGIEPCLALLAELNDFRKENKIVIEWPQGERLKISSYAGFDSLFMNVRSSGNWFELEGELRINDDLVMDMELLLERSRDSKNRFISLDDGSYLALTETLFRRLREIESWTQKNKNKLMISQFAGAAFSDFPDEMNFSYDAKWKEFIEKMKSSTKKVFDLPQGLQAELRPYQTEGFQWLNRMADWGAGACLADDMGLGKTVQAIAMLLSRSKEGPALVVAPASVCANWVSELAKFAPELNAYNLSQAQDRNKCIEDVKDAEVLVTTYGLLHQASDILCAKKFSTIVLDEAQSIKNRFTKRSQAAMELQGDFKIITTGTPIENHLGELWNLFHFINPGLLGTAKMFQERFALPIEKWGDKEKRGQLQKLIKPFILRRLKKEVLKDLPEKTEITLRIERSDEESSFYEALRRKALDNIQGGKFENEGAKRLQVLAELMRLRRCCCHPSLIAGGEKIPSSKLEALKDLVDELLQNGHKALVFSQFVDYLRIIEKEIKKMGVSYQYLDGSTPLKKRKTAIDAFQDGDGDIFLISLKAGGTGLNLTAADYVIHVDPWWNPAVEDQASDRAHRIGQQNPVTVYRLVSEGSIEEKIVKLHGSKREMAEALLQDTDGKVSLNADELLDLLKGF